MNWKNKNVAVLLGGPSSEREVSLKSGGACANALRSLGYKVTEIDVAADLSQRLVNEKIDVAFNALHGKWGEDGCVQGLLELLRIPYTGAGVLASAAAMDKVTSKVLFEASGVPVIPYRVFLRGTPMSEVAASFPAPWVVKPAAEGSSVGVSIVGKEADLSRACDEAFRYDTRIIVEPYVRGREINVGVLDGVALGYVELRPKPVEGEEFTFYDYKHKYTKGMTDYVTKPQDIDEAARREALDLGLRAYRALGVEGVARVDLILAAGRFDVLEVNTLPGMTELSLLPMIARDWAGIGFPELVERILNTARLKMGS